MNDDFSDDVSDNRGPSPGPSVSSWHTDTLGAISTTDDRDLKCMPSPLLVHSRRPINQDQLTRFTSYSRTRQLSGESFSLVPEDDGHSQVASPNHSQPLQSGSKSLRATLSDTSALLHRKSQGPTPDSSPSLQQRRSSNKKLSLDMEKAQTRVRSHSMVSPTVKFKDPVVHAALSGREVGMEEGIFSTAPIQSHTSTTTPTPRRLAQLDLSGQHHLSVVNGRIITTPISPDLTPMTPTHPHIHTSTDAFTTPDPDGIPSAAVRDLCSVFGSRHGEYSTITDNIDVSCFRSLSPPRSPVPSAGPATSMAAAFPRQRAESVSSKVKQEELMEAEETERLKMEGMIRNRLRQISQDDSSGSISDIARLVVSEMDIHASATLPEEEDEDSSPEREEGEPMETLKVDAGEERCALGTGAERLVLDSGEESDGNPVV